jgi:hypothetical protein
MTDSASTDDEPGDGASGASSADSETGSAEPASRFGMIRDTIVFQIKLGVDGLKDVVLAPLSITACILDVLRGDGQRRSFHGVMRLGERFEGWLNLYGGYGRGEDDAAPVDALGVHEAGFDTIVNEAVDWAGRDIPRRERPIEVRWGERPRPSQDSASNEPASDDPAFDEAAFDEAASNEAVPDGAASDGAGARPKAEGQQPSGEGAPAEPSPNEPSSAEGEPADASEPEPTEPEPTESEASGPGTPAAKAPGTGASATEAP